MARIVIGLTDKPNGEVHIDLVATPPIEEGAAPTAAQQAAISCLKGMALEASCQGLNKGYAGATSREEE